jgi:hypothetical protein
MQIQVTNGYITGYAAIGGFPDGIEVNEELIGSLESDKIGYYRYENGQAVFDEEKYMAAQETELITEFRARRESECFPVINRGQLWYDRLTEGQKSELSAWYQAWLDVTETKTVPDKPAWIEVE